MPSPSDLGLPAKFEEWRRGQEAAVKSLLYNLGHHRFHLLNLPVGGGKTLTYVAYMLAREGERSLALTATKNQMDQVWEDFGEVGLVDMRGRSNYACRIDEGSTADEGKCTAGIFCEYMKGDVLCDYYEQKERAGQGSLVLSNYAFWLNDEEREAIGGFDNIILDEGHLAPDQISEFAAVRVSKTELDRIRAPYPRGGRRELITNWAPLVLDIASTVLAPGNEYGKLYRKQVKDLTRKLSRLCRLGENDWCHSSVRGNLWRWDLLDPAALAEDLLFRKAKRVVVVSATAKTKTLELLGVSDSIKVVEQDSPFPVSTRPIYYWPQCKVGRNMDEVGKKYLFRAIAEICSARSDRTGLIHCVSFDFGMEIYRALQEAGVGLLFLHEKGQDLATVVKRFKRAPRGTVGISPSMDTGVDLPGILCEYGIAPKLPYPNFGDPLIRARMAKDPTYVPYITLQRLQQSAGRHHRLPTDRSEFFVLDASYWMAKRYWEFMNTWFTRAVVEIPSREECPRPPRRMVA